MLKYSIEEFYEDYKTGRKLTTYFRSVIYKVFQYYKLIHSREFELPYDDRLDNINFDSLWIKVREFVENDIYDADGYKLYRYSYPIHLRNEMNIPLIYIFKENWKELIENLVKQKNGGYNEEISRMTKNKILSTIKNYSLLRNHIKEIYLTWQAIRIDIIGGNNKWPNQKYICPLYTFIFKDNFCYINEELKESGWALTIPTYLLWNYNWKDNVIEILEAIRDEKVLEKLQT